jgi:hypothetical protein
MQLLLEPTYVLRFPHAISHPPQATAPRSIRSNRRAHHANIRHRGHIRSDVAYHNGSRWRFRPIHGSRKRTLATPRNTGSARLAIVQLQRVCVPPQRVPNNRTKTSTNRQHPEAMSTSSNSSSHHASAAGSHLRPDVSTRHQSSATGHRAPVHQIKPPRPSRQHPPSWPHPVRRRVPQRVQMAVPPDTRKPEANTRDATQHRFSKVSNRAAPAGVCTPTATSKHPSQHKHQSTTSRINVHIGKPQQSPRSCCWIPLTP